MSREWHFYLEDMRHACEKVQRYLADQNRQAFFKNECVFDAVLRNLEIIGEAAKGLDSERGNAQKA